MSIERLHTQHERHFEQFRFVYPVLSRRSGGISIGVNLNPDKVCNFHCIYCQVDRVSAAPSTFVEAAQLRDELDRILDLVVSGELFTTAKFRSTPVHLRRLQDIAFSGDGEPTTYRNFDTIVQLCADTKRRRELAHVKMVLITNASQLQRASVQRALAVMDANQGEIWAKLDAGTEAYYRHVNRAATPLKQILANLQLVARQRPIVIQTLWMRINDRVPPAAEIEAYCARLGAILRGGGRIKLVQTCTIARQPAEAYVAPLTDTELDHIAQYVTEHTGIPSTAYYGTDGARTEP